MRSKRILSLVLALVMVLGTFGTVFAAPTDNVKVDWLIEEGLVQGYGDGTYGLDQAITRAEVATMVVRALGLEEEAGKMMNIPSVFPDMRGTNVAWANGYVNLAVGKGIINGYEDGTFKPSQDISYAEVAAILVRALDGMTPAEIAAATGRDWATTYLVKAAELGVLDDVVIADFNAQAQRVTIFEMVYNTINKGFGRYTIVKGIVLENNRVEKLTNADEIVVEILKEIQTANFATASRLLRGDQEKFAIEAKVGDVEHLLGKVADFTLDKDNKVINIKVDETYEYWQGPITATKNKVNSFTVELDERYKDRDERIFRTYHNDSPLSYEDFYKSVEKDKINLDFARVTTKNGKVLFVDSFTFDDVAPVQEVRRDGADVYVYNDYRDARLEKFEPRALVLGFNNGLFSRMERKDIKTNDVVHVYLGNRMIVRTDAAVKGEYEKVERNRAGDYHVYVDGEGYLVNDINYRRPVFAHDSKTFTTLYARDASAVLKDFFKEEVNVLLDINNDLQLFGADVEWNEGMAIVKQVLARGQVKFVDASNEELVLDEDYSSAISLHNLANGTTTINQRLSQFDTQDLTFVLGDDTKIDTLVRIAKADDMVEDALELESGLSKDMNNSFIRMKNSFGTLNQYTRYQVLDRTNVFAINTKTGSISASTVAKYQELLDTTKDVKAFVLSDYQVYALAHGTNPIITDRNRITQKEDIAHTIVFVNLDMADAKTDGETVLVDRVYTARTPHYVIGQRPDSAGKGIVERTAAGISLRGLEPNSIYRLNLTKDDDKLVRSYTELISGDLDVAKTWRVVGGDLRYSANEYRRLVLADANNVETEKWLVRGVEEFGTITVDSVITFHEYNNTDKDIDVLRVYPKGTRITANAGPSIVGGRLTYKSTTRIEVDGRDVYVMDADTRLVGLNGTTLAIGGANIYANPDFVENSTLVTVKDNVITITGTVADTIAEREAVAAVEKAEDTKFDQDHNVATIKVNALPAGALKTSLLDRLAAVEITAEVETVTEFNTEFAKAWIQKIVLKDDLAFDPVLNRSVKIDGNGNTLNGYIEVTADDVTIEDLTVDGSTQYGIQFYDVTGGEVNNVIVKNSAKGALLVNSSEVVVNGFTSIANPWGGIEASVGGGLTATPKLVANGVTHDGVTTPAIWIDGAIVNDGWVVAPGYTASPYTGGGKTQVWFVR